MAGRYPIASAWCGGVLVALAFPCVALGQQVNLGGGLNGASSGFHENFGTRWGLSGRGWFFNFGGAPVPQFGGFDPGAQAQLGGGFRGPGGGGFFGLTAGQGADTTFGSQAASVTVMNGQSGYFFDGRLTPFVTGVVPVVGNQPPSDPSPLNEKLARLEYARQVNQQAAVARGEDPAAVPLVPERDPAPAPAATGGAGGGGASTANQGAKSLQAIRAQLAEEEAAQAAEIAGLLAQAEQAEADGKKALAKNFYQQAWRRSSGAQRGEIAERVKRLGR